MSRLSRAVRKTWLYRRLFPPQMPQALVIGAQKCGTSALFHYLAQHPRFCASREKEVAFFGSDLRYGMGLAWYASFWDRKAPAEAIRIEASPQYMFEAKAAPRIREHLPDIRMIAVLRDPVARAYSAWQMYRRQLAENRKFYVNHYGKRYTAKETAPLVPRTAAELEDFWLAVQREADCLERGQRMKCSVLELGLYGPQLRHYLDVFPRHQLLVLDSADLRMRRAQTLNRVLGFLGLPPWDWSGADLADVFVGKSDKPMPTRAHDFLREYFTDSNRLLQGLLDPLPAWAQPPGTANVASVA